MSDVFCPYTRNGACPCRPQCPTNRDRACVNGEDKLTWEQRMANAAARRRLTDEAEQYANHQGRIGDGVIIYGFPHVISSGFEYGTHRDLDQQ